MPRGLDHIVRAVSDFDAAAPIEVLTVAESSTLGNDGLPKHFGIPNRDGAMTAILHGGRVDLPRRARHK